MQEIRQQCSRNSTIAGGCMGGSLVTGANISANLLGGSWGIPVGIVAGMGIGAKLGGMAGRCYYDRCLQPAYRDVGEGLVIRRLPPGFHRDEHFDRSLLRYARGVHAAGIQYHAGGGNPSRVVRPPFHLPTDALERIESRIPRYIIEQEDELIRQAASGEGKEDD